MKINTPAEEIPWNAIAEYCDETLDSIHAAELEKRLLQDVAALEAFISYMDLHANLTWNSRARSEAMPQVSMPIERPRISDDMRPDRHMAPPVRMKRVFASAAALLLIGLCAIGWLVARPSAHTPTFTTAAPIATLVKQADAEVTVPGSVVGPGSILTAGPVVMSAGCAEFDYFNGVRVIVEGPARFELKSASLLVLETGRLSARVPPPAIGFTVQTASARVVDLGTEFGVAAGAGQTDVQVFEGVVEVHPADGATRPAVDASSANEAPVRLVKGDARQFASSPDAASRDLSDEDSGSFLRELPLSNGVVAIGGSARWMPTPPLSIEPGALRDSDGMFLFAEARGVRLAEPLRALTDLTARHSPGGAARLIAAGTRVDSYLLHFEPADPEHPRPALGRFRVDFDRPVLGVIESPVDLFASDRTLGAPSTRYPDIRDPHPAYADFTLAGKDRRKLRIRYSRNAPHQIRVLVAADSSNAISIGDIEK